MLQEPHAGMPSSTRPWPGPIRRNCLNCRGPSEDANGQTAIIGKGIGMRDPCEESMSNPRKPDPSCQIQGSISIIQAWCANQLWRLLKGRVDNGLGISLVRPLVQCVNAAGGGALSGSSSSLMFPMAEEALAADGMWDGMQRRGEAWLTSRGPGISI